ncbi:uncharacterized protein [Typha angustifolia]|uniref:uncharacterized protein n=1 Tax=Typha angustifolia TaxID=59011 RepID=UPI003C3034EE
MPFPMKVQPIDSNGTIRCDQAKPAAKSRLKRLFERQFPGVLRTSSAEKLSGAGDGRDVDTEPSSLCLDKMVQSFMEGGGNERLPHNRNRCNCFHGNSDDISDDELDLAGGDASSIVSSGDAAEILKGLVLCASVAERNLLADVSNLVEKSKNCKRKDDLRGLVTAGLRSIGYDASICKSRWEKFPSFPAGEYEYVDVILDDGDRVLVDVDFRSEFEIARSTKSYRAALQSLPSIFVGKGDRLERIVAVASEAARQSMKKKGLHIPPWRKSEYMRAKWLASYERSTPPKSTEVREEEKEQTENSGEVGEKAAISVAWELPELKPKSAGRGEKVVTGLASMLRERS